MKPLEDSCEGRERGKGLAVGVSRRRGRRRYRPCAGFVEPLGVGAGGLGEGVRGSEAGWGEGEMASDRAGLYAFGWNGAGQLGTGDKVNSNISTARHAHATPHERGREGEGEGDGSERERQRQRQRQRERERESDALLLAAPGCVGVVARAARGAPLTIECVPACVVWWFSTI